MKLERSNRRSYKKSFSRRKKKNNRSIKKKRLRVSKKKSKTRRSKSSQAPRARRKSKGKRRKSFKFGQDTTTPKANDAAVMKTKNQVSNNVIMTIDEIKIKICNLINKFNKEYIENTTQNSDTIFKEFDVLNIGILNIIKPVEPDTSKITNITKMMTMFNEYMSKVKYEKNVTNIVGSYAALIDALKIAIDKKDGDETEKEIQNVKDMIKSISINNTNDELNKIILDLETLLIKENVTNYDDIKNKYVRNNFKYIIQSMKKEIKCVE